MRMHIHAHDYFIVYFGMKALHINHHIYICVYMYVCVHTYIYIYAYI